MRLHENPLLFKEAIVSAAQPKVNGGLGIKALFIEKDYWICHALSLLADSEVVERVVFKGGTSLTKAYNIGTRFSEDIDIAILDANSLSGNQLKTLIRKTAHTMTQGLQEIVRDSTSKGSHYHKAFYQYPRVITEQVDSVNSGELLLEINSFANPFPYQKCHITSFLTEFMMQHNQWGLIDEYGLQSMELKVLDCRRTLTEKLVSLMRCSLADDYLPQMTAKIRHFYDLYYLLHDDACQAYIHSDEFHADFQSLLEHDRQSFNKPDGWQTRPLNQSPLIVDLHATWQLLQPTYINELPDLAYRDIPSVDAVEDSIATLLSLIIINS